MRLALLSADPLKRSIYALLSVPVGIVSLVLNIVGQSGTAARSQRSLARRLLQLALDEQRHRPFDGRVILHSLLSLPVNVVAAALTTYIWAGVALNFLYPLRPGRAPTDWGGPSLVGRWIVHAAGGLLFLLVGPLLIRAITRLQSWLLVRVLRGDRR